jgi:hypothetical protein
MTWEQITALLSVIVASISAIGTVVVSIYSLRSQQRQERWHSDQQRKWAVEDRDLARKWSRSDYQIAQRKEYLVAKKSVIDTYLSNAIKQTTLLEIAAKTRQLTPEQHAELTSTATY